MTNEWRQTGWRGGISDDRVVGVSNSFQYGESLEIRKNPSSLKLSYAAEKDSSTTVVAQINAITTIASTGDIIAADAAGNCYRKTAGAGAWVLCYTDTGASPILNLYEYNDVLYYANATHLNSIAVADIDDSWSGDVTEDAHAFTVGNTNAHPMLELYNNLYIGDGYYLAELDSLGSFTGDKIEIFHDEEIRGLTYTNGYMRFYARKSTFLDFGHIYLWDGTAETHNQNVIWEGKMIHSAVSMDGYDYVIAGVKPILYQVVDTTPYALKKLYGVGDTEDALMAANSMDISGTYILFGTCASGTNSMPRGTWTYGQHTKDYTPCLNFDYPTSPGKATDVVTCVHESRGVIYQAWYDSDAAAYGIDVVNTAKYATTGYLITRVFSGDRAYEEKLLKGIYLASTQLSADEKIEVFVRTDLQTSWGSAVLSLDYATVADRAKNQKRSFSAAGKGSFNFLEITSRGRKNEP